MIDSSCARARQHVAAGKRGWLYGTLPRGLISKIHALVAIEDRPVCLRLTAAQDVDCTKAEAMISTISEGDILLADKGYDSDVICAKEKQPKGLG